MKIDQFGTKENQSNGQDTEKDKRNEKNKEENNEKETNGKNDTTEQDTKPSVAENVVSDLAETVRQRKLLAQMHAANREEEERKDKERY